MGLVVALYDGIVRFLNDAIAAVERGDAHARRVAVKRAMDIVMHLQGTLRMDVGGKTAETLSDFYAAIFALMLQGSQLASKEKFEQAIAYVWNVREAWRQVEADTSAPRAEEAGHVAFAGETRPEYAAARWSA